MDDTDLNITVADHNKEINGFLDSSIQIQPQPLGTIEWWTDMMWQLLTIIKNVVVPGSINTL